MLDVEAAIRRVIKEVKPQVLLTFDPHGGYYHPDHLAVQRATTAAFFSSGAMGAVAPERLFYVAMLRDVFHDLADKSRGRCIADGLDPDVFGAAREMIAVSFDASSFVQQKFLALAAHRSAFGVTEEMLSNPPTGTREMLDAFRPVFEREVFVLGGTRVSTPHWPLRDLFDGIHSAALGRVRATSSTRFPRGAQ
jgi:LmbE family N-acetylglucosaminyl deacetylase